MTIVKCSVPHCNKEAKIKKLCKAHYWQEIRKKSKKLGVYIPKDKYISKTQVSKISKKYSEGLKLYKKARKEYLQAHGCCEVKLPGCTIPTINGSLNGLTIHHKMGRVGSLLYDKNYFLAVCMNCHSIIEKEPTLSKLNGWSLDRLKKQE